MLELIGGNGVVQIPHLDGGGEAVVDPHDATGAEQAGGVALLTVYRPTGGHGAGRAAVHPQDAQGVVVHADEVILPVVLVEGQDLGGGFDNRLPRQILHQIDLVDTQIRQSAHNGLFLVEEPVALHGPALRPGGSKPRAEGDDVTDDPLLQQFLGPAMHRIEAHIVADHQMPVVELRRRHHGLALRQRYSHGLLAQHVLPGVESRRGHLRMAAVLHTHGYGVDLRVLQQIEVGVVDLSAVLGGHLVRPLAVLVIVGHQLCVGVGGIFRQMAHLGDLAAADDSNSYHTVRSFRKTPVVAPIIANLPAGWNPLFIENFTPDAGRPAVCF